MMVTRRQSRLHKIEPGLSESEWALVLELLERERTNLPKLLELRPGSAPRADLHERLSMLDRILAEVRRAALRRDEPAAP